MFRYLPEPASDVAADVDWLHNWITDISVFFIVLICGTMVYFAVRYRRTGKSSDESTPRIEGNNSLEMVWTAVPTIISVVIAYYGIVVFKDLRHVPENAMRIDVTGYQWGWKFNYQNGKKTAKEIYVPVNQPTKLVMTSNDVIHSFFIPAMRVKKDVVPGQYSYVSFTPNKTGTYQVYCTEYCGTNHSNMMVQIHVVPEAEFARWVEDKGPVLTPVEIGKKVYVENGCNACHSLNGQRIVGPSWLKLAGSERELESGETVVADEDYLRDSILYPAKQIVAGYGNLMASYEGILDEDQIRGVIAFIQTLDGSQPVEEVVEEEAAEEVDMSQLSAAERGEVWYKSNNLLCSTCHSIDGSQLVGPSFKGLWMKEGTLQDGSTYTADADYITKSIKEPNSQVVQGFAPAMPNLPVTDDQISDLIEYIKTLE